MATFTRSQSLLVSAGAGALSGAALLTVLGGNIFTVAGAGATAIDLSPSDFPICHTPAATGLPSMMLRLAQTEVPRAEMSAAKSAPAFADTEAPLWAGLACSPCVSALNNRQSSCRDNVCMQRLLPEQVFQAVCRSYEERHLPTIVKQVA